MAAVGGGGMPGRRLVILVLLFAVLSMHGVQSMSAGARSPAAVSADHSLHPVAITALALAPAALVDDMTMSPEQPADPSAAAEGTMPGHSVPAHVWSLCLAVLLAGLALLGAALVWRTTTALRALSTRARLPVLTSVLPRPPDLSVLCLLRI